MSQPKSLYSHIPQADRARLQAWVSHEDKHFITSIVAERGFVCWALETFYHTLVQDAKKHGITNYSSENASALVGFVRQRTDTRITNPGPVENGTGGVERVCTTTSNLAIITPIIHESAPGRDGGRGGRRQKVEGGQKVQRKRKGSE